MDLSLKTKAQLAQLAEHLEIEVPHEGKRPTKDEYITELDKYEDEDLKAGFEELGITDNADDEAEEEDEDTETPEPEEEKKPPVSFKAPKEFEYDYEKQQEYARNRLQEIIDNGGKLEGLKLAAMDLSGLVCIGKSLKGCNMENCIVEGANFQGCDFTDANVTGVDFSKADIRWAVGLEDIRQNHMGQQV